MQEAWNPAVVNFMINNKRKPVRLGGMLKDAKITEKDIKDTKKKMIKRFSL